MAITKLADVIKAPALVTSHISQAVVENSRLIRSRAVSSNAFVNELANSAATEGKIPFNNPLGGQSQNYTEQRITVNGIGSGMQNAIAVLRANAWGASDLAIDLSGDDKMGAISQRTSSFWTEDLSRTLMFLLDGISKATSMQSNVTTFEYDPEQELEKQVSKAIVAAEGTLGLNRNKLRTLVVNSAFETLLKNSNLVTYVRDPANADIEFTRYLGKYDIVVVESYENEAEEIVGLEDDEFILLGDGALFIGDGSESLEHSTEVARDPLGSETALINRRKYVMHLNGVSFTGDVAGVSATDAEINDGANWTRVYEPKNVLFVKSKMVAAEPVA